MSYALVTGCDHGLGLSLARQLLSRDYSVIACRVNPEERQVDELAASSQGRLSVETLDVSSDESVSLLAARLKSRIPHLDLLINCAGILGDMHKTLGDELDYDEMLRVFNVNALGPLRLTNALCGLLAAGEGKLIANISSEAGSIADCWRRGWFGYCMSKAANNMQGALCQNALREKGVRVVQLHPGHVATYMRGHLDTTASLTPDESARAVLQVLLDRPLPDTQGVTYMDWQGRLLPY